jgi:hypothetical protein
MGNSDHGTTYMRVGGKDGELRPWHYMCVYSIKSRLIRRVMYRQPASAGNVGAPPCMQNVFCLEETEILVEQQPLGLWSCWSCNL